MRATISASYLAEQVALHESGGYGANSDKWAPFVMALADHIGADSILDYGCGQGKLVDALAAEWRGDVQGYDPAVPAFAARPIPAALVICSDVLEHVEPACLKAVFMDLAQLTQHALFTVIATRPSRKVLSDGRNAHLIIEPAEWWARMLETRGWRRLPCCVEYTVADPGEYAGLWTRKDVIVRRASRSMEPPGYCSEGASLGSGR